MRARRDRFVVPSSVSRLQTVSKYLKEMGISLSEFALRINEVSGCEAEGPFPVPGGEVSQIPVPIHGEKLIGIEFCRVMI